MWQSLRNKGHSLASSVLSALYPSVCPVCKNPSDIIQYAPLCKACWKGITRYRGPSCRICAVPLVSEYSRTCGECLHHPPPFSLVMNFGLYSGALSEAIHALKFSGIRRLARHLGALLTELPLPRLDGIVPVPVTKKTLRERGFNQALLLSRFLSKEVEVPIFMETLYKIRDTLPQIGLGARERAVNLKNAFGVKGDVAGKHLLLLDDVMTTGATVRECSKTLRKAGAREVIVATLARAVLTEPEVQPPFNDIMKNKKA